MRDDHMFGLSAAKYGGIYVPPHIASFISMTRGDDGRMRGMILGSDSHTRYGALGTMAVGRRGGELVKAASLGYIRCCLSGRCSRLSGRCAQPEPVPRDIAPAIIGAVFKNGYVKIR